MKLQRPMAQNKTMFERSRLKLHHSQKKIIGYRSQYLLHAKQALPSELIPHTFYAGIISCFDLVQEKLKLYLSTYVA